MSKRDLLNRRQTTLQERTEQLYRPNGHAVADNALVPRGDGTLSYGNIEFTRIGVKFIDDLQADDWERLVTMLGTAQESLQWWIGDLFAYGERAGYGEAKDIAEHYGYQPSTVHNFTWVCKAVEFSLRREVLSFGHHKLVARLPRDQQIDWLAKAELGDWSVARLRAEINGGGSSVDYTTVLQRFTSSVKQAVQLPAHYRRDLADKLRQMADELEG